jgi:transketolase
MSYLGKAPHLGSALSCLDLIYLAYKTFLNINSQNPLDSKRDRFILSKGHAISALYAVLAEMGYFNKSLLETFNQNGSLLPEHPTPNCIPGVEFATGSLGHGLSLGCGLALSSKIKKEQFKVVVLLSDGELNEGTVWEAAQFATVRQLNNLIGIIDFNKWQATGRSTEIMKLEPLKNKWESFGFIVYEIDGHDHLEITNTFKNLKSKNQPTMIIAHTVKGKGISFMEDDNNWHYRIPSHEDMKKIRQELQII